MRIRFQSQSILGNDCQTMDKGSTRSFVGPTTTSRSAPPRRPEWSSAASVRERLHPVGCDIPATCRKVPARSAVRREAMDGDSTLDRYRTHDGPAVPLIL